MRSEKLISGHHLRMSWMEDGEWTSRPATVADIRRLVESGTIKGKQIEHYCVAHEGRVWAYPDVTECAFQLNQRAGLGQPTETPCDLQRVVVIPVSDGGEVDTPGKKWRCIGEGNRCGPHSFLWRDETHDRCGWVSDGGEDRP